MRILHQTGRPILALGAGLLLGLSSLWMACSSESSSGSSCAESRCKAGESQCFGNAVWTCMQGQDEMVWDKAGCGSLKTCVDAACVDRAACLVGGKRECAQDGLSYTICAADGMSETTVTCAAGEICQEGACVSETCTTGDTRCGDGALLTCEAGSNWASAACGAGEICTEDADGARCEDRVCQPLLASCDAGAAVVCDVDGRSETRTPCADDEICEMGYCVTATCDEIAAGHAGTIAAGCAEVCEAIFAPDSTDNVRECVGDLADAQSCEPPDGHEEGCDITDRACSEDIFLTEESCILAGYTWGSVPYENEDGCEGAEGTWTAPWPTYDDSHDVASCKQWMKACDVSTSACEELNTAWCECSDCLADQDALAPTADAAGGATEDAGPEEVAPHPGLEPISHISFKLSGIPNEFTLAAMADYQESDKRFVISASDGARKLEINLAPVEGYTVGAWSDSDDSDSSVAVCYHDGSQNETPPEGAGCSVGFSHAAILYILSIDQNNGDGSRVTGNFVATLVDSSNAELEFTEGTFDVLHQ